MSVRSACRRLGACESLGFSGRPRAARVLTNTSRRRASSATASDQVISAAEDISELEPASGISQASPPSSPGDFDPVARARRRKRELPPSRYQFRPPKYYRGPLHPHQPPPPSDPASREFIPGPFTFPALEQSYHSTIASDLMTLSYQHFPPGYEEPPRTSRLREWDGSSPYHKGRPLRAPRGGGTLRPARRPITFRNVPSLSGVTVHAFAKEANDDSAALHVASMAVQAITGARCTAHQARRSVPNWGLKRGKYVAVTAELAGEDMYHFLSKCVSLVLPRIRDFRGLKGSTGDSTGNLMFGLKPEAVAYFPEVEINYDAYPPKLVPGCHVIVRTTATNDRDARMLLTTLGFPFYGKLVD